MVVEVSLVGTDQGQGDHPLLEAAQGQEDLVHRSLLASVGRVPHRVAEALHRWLHTQALADWRGDDFQFGSASELQSSAWR